MASNPKLHVLVPQWFVAWAVGYSTRELLEGRQPDQAFLRFMAFVVIDARVDGKKV